VTIRDQIAALMAERARAAAALAEIPSTADADFEVRCAEYLKLIKRKPMKDRNARYTVSEKCEAWEDAALRAPILARYRPEYEALRSERRWLDFEIDRLCEDAAPLPGNAWIELRRTHPHHTQGFGADHYGENEAKLYASERDRLGVQVRVRKVTEGVQSTDRWGCPSGYRYWVVEAYVAAEVDAEILRHKSLPLREWLAACWARQTNPRVLCPGLPHGLEEKLGVDYFGNIKERAHGHA